MKQPELQQIDRNGVAYRFNERNDPQRPFDSVRLTTAPLDPKNHYD